MVVCQPGFYSFGCSLCHPVPSWNFFASASNSASQNSIPVNVMLVGVPFLKPLGKTTAGCPLRLVMVRLPEPQEGSERSCPSFSLYSAILFL